MPIIAGLLWCVFAAGAVAPDVAAQPYPDKPLRWVVPFPPGGGADSLARIIGQRLGEDLGQHVVVDNRSGAGGNIAAEVAARAAPAAMDLIAGRVLMMFFTIPAALPLRPLATASLRRAAQLPEVPTAEEAGVRGFEAATWFGVMVPAGTRARMIVARLHEAFTGALHAAPVRERLPAQGFELVGGTPQQFGAHVRAEIAAQAKERA